MINTVAMSYNWDNVYNYDMIFRQLMEFNPSRNWAVTYNQMWNLSMTNPLNAAGQSRRQSFGQSHNNNNSSGNSSRGQSFKKRNDYCWSFNRVNKCKFGKRCKFIERCSYCDSPFHGLVKCKKLDKRDKEVALAGNYKKTKSPK